jgi:hypothetical protein
MRDMVSSLGTWLHKLINYYYDNQIKENEITRTYGTNSLVRHAELLITNPKRPTHRMEENSEMDIREIGCKDRNWIHLAQGRV